MEDGLLTGCDLVNKLKWWFTLTCPGSPPLLCALAQSCDSPANGVSANMVLAEPWGAHVQMNVIIWHLCHHFRPCLASLSQPRPCTWESPDKIKGNTKKQKPKPCISEPLYWQRRNLKSRRKGKFFQGRPRLTANFPKETMDVSGWWKRSLKCQKAKASSNQRFYEVLVNLVNFLFWDGFGFICKKSYKVPICPSLRVP